MRLSKPFTLLSGAAVIPLAAMAIAGCGGNNNRATATPPKTSSGRAATIGAESGGSLGKILVDSQGRTIYYLFEKDTGPKSTCSGECAVQWPPVTVNGTPTVGNGLDASQVGTAQRSDGKAQVSYNGHPLYRFEGDHKPGDVNGQGLDAFGAAWYVLSPSGTAVTRQGSSSAGGGGNGY